MLAQKTAVKSTRINPLSAAEKAGARLDTLRRHLSSGSASNGISPVKLSNVSRMTIFGAGLMGAGIAQVAAHTGFKVVVCDVSEKALDNGRRIIQQSIARIAKRTHPKDEDSQKALVASVFDNISMTTDPLVAVEQADIVIEAIVENLKLKQDLFSMLDEKTNAECIFATNTGSLSVTEIASSTKEERRKSCVGGVLDAEPSVLMMDLVEVVKTNEILPEIFDTLVQVCTRMQKRPVICSDTPGFIVNRLLVPYLAEAIRMLERGGVSAKDIDAAMKMGAGYPMGPFELMDVVGLDTTKHYLDGWREAALNQQENALPLSLLGESPLLNEKVSQGKLGRKSGEGFFKYT